MPSFKKYRLNPETLLCEIEKVSKKTHFRHVAAVVLSSLLMMCVYLWVFTRLLGLDLPKTALLERKNSEWVARLEQLNFELDRSESTLEGLRLRDEQVYRNIFGLDSIPLSVRNSGLGGLKRYVGLEGLDDRSLLRTTALRLDRLTKKTYIQSKSFDDISAYAKRADDRASCIPAIMPINPDPTTYRRSSGFGYRTDPFTSASKMHTGYDFSCPQGNPVYVTGDGVVEEVRFELRGYGNSVLVNHGFGYKTRYAHLRNVYVAEGMTLKRGECIGETGNTGRSSGPHLHYEVIFRNSYVNPVNFMDFDMPEPEYRQMVEQAQAQSQNVILRTGQRIRR